MSGILLDWIGGRLMDWLPRRIVRIFVRLDVVAGQIKFGLNSKSPVVVNLNESVPNVRVYIQVENHSGLDVVLDRAVLEVWAGQPIVYGVFAHRVPVPRHSTQVPLAPFVGALSSAAISRLNEYLKGQMRPTYTVNATAYFDSKLGPFVVQLGGYAGEVPA